MGCGSPTYVIIHPRKWHGLPGRYGRCALVTLALSEWAATALARTGERIEGWRDTVSELLIMNEPRTGSPR
jgi:hypothetical protein